MDRFLTEKAYSGSHSSHLIGKNNLKHINLSPTLVLPLLMTYHKSGRAQCSAPTSLSLVVCIFLKTS